MWTNLELDFQDYSHKYKYFVAHKSKGTELNQKF